MTKEIENKICILRIANIGIKTIAKQLDQSIDQVRRVCKKNNLNGFRARQLLTDDEVAKRIERVAPDFEYIGGWENVDKYVYLQCKWCGNIFRHSAQFLKLYHCHTVRCKQCDEAIRTIKKDYEKNSALAEKIRKRENKIWNGSFTQMRIVSCKNCGTLYFTDKAKSICCSSECSKRLSLRRRYKIKEEYRYKIPLDKLFERDRGICHICGEKCDLNDFKTENGSFVAGPMYPSRDHVIPKSKGGSHSWSNIRLAHFRCNTLKGSGDD